MASVAEKTTTRAVEAARDLARVAIAFKQVSEPPRLQIMLSLAGGEKNVGELVAILGMTQPAVSHHLSLLRHGHLVEVRRQGKHNYYGLVPGAGTALAEVARAMMASS